MPTHSRKSSGGALQQQHQQQQQNQHPPPPRQPQPPQHDPSRRNTLTAHTSPAPKPTRQRTNTNPEPPTLLRLPSTTSTSSAAARRPPASHSAHGIDNSRGPPVTLVTRSRSSQNPADLTYAHQQFSPTALASHTGPTPLSKRRGEEETANWNGPPQKQLHHIPQQTGTTASPSLLRPPAPRRNSTASSRPPPRRMASSTESSEYDSGPRSRMEDYHAAHSGRGAPAPVTPGTDGEKEDLFLNIAADSAPKQQQHQQQRPAETTARIDRLKSRVARINERQSYPSALQTPSPSQSSSATATSSRIPSVVDARPGGLRRGSLLPTPSRYERSQNSPAPESAHRTPQLSHKVSLSSVRRDSDLSPRDFLAQFSSTRRASQPDVTPPSRTPLQPYRPSNLSHEPRTPHIETSFEAASRADGTESHGSTGPAASVWDELDELKSRIRKIEMGGKIPSTSGAIVSQASADRPRTANTSATTVSSSPNQQRKANLSPSNSTVGALTPNGSNNINNSNNNNKTHPLLREALAKARQHISPAVYRTLEATAQEALALAEMSGSAGPQGTLHSASTIANGAVVSDRQVRRKADNLCRSLTELCIALCDTKTGFASPAFRSSTATISRRPSVQFNGESPTIRESIEPESNTLSGVSPSRAMSRIEARRSSMLAVGTGGNQRETSQEPYDDRHLASRLQRAGTSLHRARKSAEEDDDDTILFRAPSRAMTSIDFRSRQQQNESNRYSTGRQIGSREPMSDLQPSPAIQTTSHLRRPSVSSSTPSNEHSLLFRDQNRFGHNLGREGSPAHFEKPLSAGLRARTQLSVARNPSNRHSVGGITDLGRNVSLGRRLRGSSTGE